MDSIESMSDTELLDYYCGYQSRAALEMLIERHRGLVLGVTYGYTRDLQAAVAAASRVFSSLAREATAIRGRVELTDWLRRAAGEEGEAHQMRFSHN